jgi:hypothetical protein
MIRDLYIKANASGGGSRSTAKLMRTGQTTSYRTGDDGNLQSGRAVDFFTLAENNPFGNTNRFTDELGGQTYTNDIVIDWSTYDGATVFGFRRTTTANTWNNAVTGALAVSIGTFTTGWRLPNVIELINLTNFELTNSFNYPPFNYAGGLHTSNTHKNNTASAILHGGTGLCIAFAKTNTQQYIPCRNFTVTGTTLT